MSSRADTTLIQRFFLRGDEQEATGYANLPFDDPVLVPSKLPFKSFDRIPRYRRAPYVLALLTLAVVGVESWQPARALVNGNAYVQAAARATVRAATRVRRVAQAAVDR